MEETLESMLEIPPNSSTLHEETMNKPYQPTPVDTESGGSDSDSDSDSEEDEGQKKLQLQTLESELLSSPYNYDAHVQYIQLLRKMSDIEKLRKARQAMSEIFPLTATMWQEWAKDEASISTGPEAVAEIERLYERGVFDYLSVSLWCDYLNFVQEYDKSVRECSTAGLSKARYLFERATTAAGLHVTEGNKIWEAYREFEQAIFHTIDETDIQAKEKQSQRIRSIFNRQLSLPLDNMRSTLQTYKAWENEQGHALDVETSDLDGISSQVALAYQKALEMYNSRIQFEDQISRQDIADSERLQQFMVYLKFEQSSGDPARVQVLYERAITDFPIASNLWLDYGRYMDETLKVGNILKNMYFRATKNCPWVGEIWVRYLLTLERARASEKDIAAVFEKSLQCTFSSHDEYMDLYLTRVDGLRRRISSSAGGEDVLDYALIRDTFQRGSDHLSPHLKNTDSLLRVYAYWARLELNLGKDLVAARGIWESLLKICGSMVEAWQSYIAMEVELKHIKEARSIYKRCYSKRFLGTGSEDICRSWLRFEREFGALEDFDHAVKKVYPRLEELLSFRVLQESNNAERESPLKRNALVKRKASPDISLEQSPAKRQKDAAQKPKYLYGKDKESVNTGKSKESAGKSDGTSDQHKKNTAKEKAKLYTDQCTAFISNLHLNANYEHLRDFFSDVGGVGAIRILHDKFTGKSRGLAYVDFDDDEHLTVAVAKNRQMLLGKKLSIARSDPKKNKKESEDRGGKSKGSGSKGTETSKEGRAPQTHRGDNIQLKGKNTFAVPRNVRVVLTSNKPKAEGHDDETPKSNN